MAETRNEKLKAPNGDPAHPKTEAIREVSGPPPLSLFKSPQMILILVAGVAMVLGVPYMAFRTIPGSDKPLPSTATPSDKGDANATIDLKEFDGLTEDLKDGARAIYAADDPIQPEVLQDLMPTTGGAALTYPVNEAIDSTLPALSWTNFAPPPYDVVVKNKKGEVVAQVKAVPNMSWIVTTMLDRGGTYTWEVTATTTKESESASFVVLTPQASQVWQGVRGPLANSHLALGTAAEQLGLLTIAENEYRAAQKMYPQAEAPGRMLTNVMSLRDPSVKDNAPEPLIK